MKPFSIALIGIHAWSISSLAVLVAAPDVSDVVISVPQEVLASPEWKKVNSLAAVQSFLGFEVLFASQETGSPDQPALPPQIQGALRVTGAELRTFLNGTPVSVSPNTRDSLGRRQFVSAMATNEYFSSILSVRVLSHSDLDIRLAGGTELQFDLRVGSLQKAAPARVINLPKGDVAGNPKGRSKLLLELFPVLSQFIPGSRGGPLADSNVSEVSKAASVILSLQGGGSAWEKFTTNSMNRNSLAGFGLMAFDGKGTKQYHRVLLSDWTGNQPYEVQDFEFLSALRRSMRRGLPLQFEVLPVYRGQENVVQSERPFILHGENGESATIVVESQRISPVGIASQPLSSSKDTLIVPPTSLSPGWQLRFDIRQVATSLLEGTPSPNAVPPVNLVFLDPEQWPEDGRFAGVPIGLALSFGSDNNPAVLSIPVKQAQQPVGKSYPDLAQLEASGDDLRLTISEAIKNNKDLPLKILAMDGTRGNVTFFKDNAIVVDRQPKKLNYTVAFKDGNDVDFVNGAIPKEAWKSGSPIEILVWLGDPMPKYDLSRTLGRLSASTVPSGQQAFWKHRPLTIKTDGDWNALRNLKGSAFTSLKIYFTDNTDRTKAAFKEELILRADLSQLLATQSTIGIDPNSTAKAPQVSRAWSQNATSDIYVTPVFVDKDGNEVDYVESKSTNINLQYSLRVSGAWVNADKVEKGRVDFAPFIKLARGSIEQMKAASAALTFSIRNVAKPVEVVATATTRGSIATTHGRIPSLELPPSIEGLKRGDESREPALRVTLNNGPGASRGSTENWRELEQNWQQAGTGRAFDALALEFTSDLAGSGKILLLQSDLRDLFRRGEVIYHPVRNQGSDPAVDFAWKQNELSDIWVRASFRRADGFYQPRLTMKKGPPEMGYELGIDLYAGPPYTYSEPSQGPVLRVPRGSLARMRGTDLNLNLMLSAIKVTQAYPVPIAEVVNETPEASAIQAARIVPPDGQSLRLELEKAPKGGLSIWRLGSDEIWARLAELSGKEHFWVVFKSKEAGAGELGRLEFALPTSADPEGTLIHHLHARPLAQVTLVPNARNSSMTELRPLQTAALAGTSVSVETTFSSRPGGDDLVLTKSGGPCGITMSLRVRQDQGPPRIELHPYMGDP